MVRVFGACATLSMLLSIAAPAQVIQFESNGLHYQTLTRSGVTIMLAHLPARLHEYSIIQVVVSNGSAGPYVIRPEDFSIECADGTTVHGAPAHDIIEMEMQKGSGSDVVKLVTTYSPPTGMKPAARVRWRSVRPGCARRPPPARWPW